MGRRASDSSKDSSSDEEILEIASWAPYDLVTFAFIASD